MRVPSDEWTLIGCDRILAEAIVANLAIVAEGPRNATLDRVHELALEAFWNSKLAGRRWDKDTVPSARLNCVL